MPEQSPLHEYTSALNASYTEEAGYELPKDFGDAQQEYQLARESCILVDRSHTGKVELTGSEANSFLNNLCTNEVLELPLGAGCEAFLATAKAKVVSHLFVYHIHLEGEQPALWLDVPPGTAEDVVRHLDHFLISEQVEMADRTKEFGQVHLAGPKAKKVLELALVDEIPDLQEHQHMMRTFGTNDTAHIRKHSPLGVPGYDIVFLKSRSKTIWEMLVRSGATPTGLQAWEWLRVEQGTPVLGIDMDETTFVSEVGRNDKAVSFAKGCYLGQEPVVMARDRGQINRTLMGLQLPEGIVPFNSKLFAEGKQVGRVTSTVDSPRLGPIALGYVKRGQQEPGNTLEVEVDGARRPAEVIVLPFPLK